VEEALGSQVSPLAPDHVPSSDRHTFPQLYRLGLNRTVVPPAGTPLKVAIYENILFLFETADSGVC